jgi:hypothetical protein
MKIKLPQRIGLVRLSLIAVVVGLITGFGAVVFRALIGLFHNIAFLGRLAVNYDASAFTPPSPWGVFVILVPVLGGVVVTFLITNFAPEARGHGVPEVMDAIYYKEGVIRPVVALIKIPGVGALDWHWRCRGPRGSHHSDRGCAGLDIRPGDPHGALAAHHTRCCGSSRGYRRDF